MTTKKIEIVKNLCISSGGIIKTSVLNQNSITSRNIKSLIEKGILCKIKQGHYIWNENTDTTTDIEIVAKLIPNAVICLFSAVDYYELSTLNPTEICIALPRGSARPILPENLFVKFYYMTSKHFELGITETDYHSTIIKIYDIEKTVCDCFKYEQDVEKSIALEVLKNYMSRSSCNIQKLLEYAKVIGKKKVIYPYVEALL